MLKISRYGTKGRLPLELHQGAESVIIGSGGGRRSVLWVKWEEQDALTALGLQPTQHVIRGGITVPHAEVDQNLVTVARRKPLGDFTRLLPSYGQQRAFVLLGIPDATVSFA